MAVTENVDLSGSSRQFTNIVFDFSGEDCFAWSRTTSFN